MDSGEMHELLHGYLREMNWHPGVTKDDVLEHLAGRDEVLRTMVDEYLAEGTCYATYEVMDLIPAQAWQDAQGDVWRGGEIQYVEDVPSNFLAGPVGGDESDVYHEGGPRPQTPGFGESAGARGGDGGGASKSARPTAGASSRASGASGAGGNASATRGKSSGQSGKTSGAPHGGEPGDGAGRRYDPESQNAGVWPASGPPAPDPNLGYQPMASFGQGERGAAGFQDHGDSELIGIPPEEIPGEGASGGSQG